MAHKSGCILCIKNIYHKNTKHQKASLFTYFSVVLFYFITVLFYKIHSVRNCIMTSYLQMLTNFPEKAKITTFLVVCIPSLVFCCGDIEKNPGPKYLSLTFCHWNLNCLTPHDSIKILLLQAYVTQHNYGKLGLSETFLNSSIDSSNTRISIDGYNLIRSDHPSDLKRGGVCIYYKELIPLIKQDDICTLGNCLVTEICSQSEKCFLTCIYCSPSQNNEEFENFCGNFDLLLSNINE